MPPTSSEYLSLAPLSHLCNLSQTPPSRDCIPAKLPAPSSFLVGGTHGLSKAPHFPSLFSPHSDNLSSSLAGNCILPAGRSVCANPAWFQLDPTLLESTTSVLCPPQDGSVLRHPYCLRDGAWGQQQLALDPWAHGTQENYSKEDAQGPEVFRL